MNAGGSHAFEAFPSELVGASIDACAAREKAMLFFDMFDFEGRGEISYDEVAICISTVVGAFSKVASVWVLLTTSRLPAP